MRTRTSGHILLAVFVGFLLSDPLIGSDDTADAPVAKGEAQDVGATTTKTFEYFAVDVGERVAGFDESYIVSDPPILRASFYQMKTDVHIATMPGVEAYLLTPANKNNKYTGYRIVGRRPQGTAAKGKFFLLRRHPDQPRESVLAKFDFNVAATVQSTTTELEFYRAKGEHFQRLWSPDYAGAAMFRHEAMDAMKKIGKKAKSVGPSWPMRRSTQGADATIAMMAGGRAVSENLALESELDDPNNYLGELKNLSEVQGITVNAIDWTDRLSNTETELDPLAKLVPHDQYAVYLPSFEKLVTIVDRGTELARPLVHWFEPQSTATNVLQLYQTQLGLPMNALTRQVGRALIGEVAVTGSDPYFRTGTDLAVLMHSEQPALLYQAITAQIAGQALTHAGVKHVDHKVDGHVFTEWSNPTRQLCSYVAQQENAVIVSNSLYQMMQVLKCSDGEVDSMHGLDEYKFFRQRYRRGSENAAALVVITDGAIRRWCGPQWRISASRRTRARAAIAEVSMKNADALLNGSIDSDTVFHGDHRMPKAGTMTLTAAGTNGKQSCIRSNEYGTLDFQTPIAEMKLWKATAKEVELYNTWRNRYERRWRRVFDPIALEIKLTDDKLAADLTVIPLVLQSEYQQFVRMVGKARLKPDAGDHHKGALVAIDVALDLNAQMFQFVRMFLQGQTNGLNLDPLAWIDGSASVYFDYDEAWLKRFEQNDPWDFDAEHLIADIPIALHVPSKDSLRLTAFIVGVRSLLNQYAPNTVEWGSSKYKDYDYITAKPRGNWTGDQEDEIEFFYVTLPDGITVSGNRGVIERAIDRHLARKSKRKADRMSGDEMAEEVTGEDANQNPDPSRERAPQLAMSITGRGAEIMTRTDYRNGLRRTHQIAWSNLPILNYFRSRYPERDPFTVYEQLFGQKLIEPTGGKYEWNEERGTYVSTQHGYHLEPRVGPILGKSLMTNDRVQTRLSFQDGGLRANLQVTRADATEKP